MKYYPIAQLKELPNNPRTIKDSSFKSLVKSITDNPEYFEARPLILSNRTGNLVIIAGNQRFKAAKEIGLKKVPCFLMENLTEEKEKEIIIRDNVSNGDWDYDILKEDWDIHQLNDWDLKIDIDEPNKTKNKSNKPASSDDDYSAFELIMLHANKLKLIEVINQIKELNSFDTTEEAIMELINIYNNETRN